MVRIVSRSRAVADDEEVTVNAMFENAGEEGVGRLQPCWLAPSRDWAGYIA